MSDFYAHNEKRQNSGGFDPNTFGKKLIIYLCISIFVVSGLNAQTEINHKKPKILKLQNTDKPTSKIDGMVNDSAVKQSCLGRAHYMYIEYLLR